MIDFHYAGNIVLYKASTPLEKFIAWGTRGIYCHVEIMTGDQTTIGAHSDGIYQGKLPINATTYTMVSLQVQKSVAPEQCKEALAWAIAQDGRAYGWLDIVDQGIDFLSRMAGQTNAIHLVDNSHMCCSDFVARYMVLAGVKVPPMFLDPYTISPNDIARFYKLLV